MTSDPSRPWRPPRQERSRQTLERLLDAAEALLEHQGLDQIPIQRIVEEAGASVGSFYARFPAKEALVAALFERYHDRVETLLRRAVGSLDETADLRDRTRALVEGVIDTCRRHRGLLRLRLQRRLASDGPEEQVERERDRRTVALLTELFAPVRHEIRRPDPDEALRFALRMVDGTALSAFVLRDITSSYGDLDWRRFGEELEVAFVGYLSGDPAHR